MKVSIITTIYKAENDLPRLLDSMMAQRSPELEFFLIDNGSPDHCGEICAEYAKKDSRFKVFTLKENIGYIRARNLGIQECDAEYIGFCDSDDFLEPRGYDNAIQKLKETGCDLYITSYKTLSDERVIENNLPFKKGLYEKEDIEKLILPQVFGSLPNKAMLHGFAWKQIFRRELILNNGLSFMVELQPYEDQIFNIDMIKQCEKLYVDSNCIYNYIINTQSITAKLVEHFNAEAEWRRLSLLYKEKKKRIENEMQKEACANQILYGIYTMLLCMVKQKNIGISVLVKQAEDILSPQMVLELIKSSSNEVDRIMKFVKKCLRKQNYYKLFFAMRLALKIRG